MRERSALYWIYIVSIFWLITFQCLHTTERAGESDGSGRIEAFVCSFFNFFLLLLPLPSRYSIFFLPFYCEIEHIERERRSAMVRAYTRGNFIMKSVHASDMCLNSWISFNNAVSDYDKEGCNVNTSSKQFLNSLGDTFIDFVVDFSNMLLHWNWQNQLFVQILKSPPWSIMLQGFLSSDTQKMFISNDILNILILLREASIVA